VQRRRDGLLDGVPQAEEWSWATDRLELVAIEVAQELSTAGESRATRADDTSLRTADDLVRAVRAAVDAGDVPTARTTWAGLELLVAHWDDGPLTERIRSTGVTLFGGLVEVAGISAPPAFLAPTAPSDRGRGGPRPPRARDRVVQLVLAAVAVLLTATGAVVAGDAAVTGFRADTPVRAQAEGCSASVTGPDGVTRTVSLRVYKGSCLQPDADGRVTVYVDDDDPSVLTARRWWQWWTLAATGAAVLGVLAARSAVNAALGLRRGRAAVSPR
jgi:hypothetical protein